MFTLSLGQRASSHHRCLRAGRPASGFTLIELLVVISIIALLIAILLPALQAARQTAQTAVCLSNVRQAGLSVMMYADDFNDYLPLASAMEGGVIWFWHERLVNRGYLPGQADADGRLVSTEALNCPAEDRVWGNQRYQIHHAPPRRYGHLEFYDPNSASNDLRWYLPRKRDAFYKPSQTNLLADHEPGYSSGYNGGMSSENTWYESASEAKLRGPERRHPGKRTNILFIDGHAGTHDLDEMSYWAMIGGGPGYTGSEYYPSPVK